MVRGGTTVRWAAARGRSHAGLGGRQTTAAVSVGASSTHSSMRTGGARSRALGGLERRGASFQAGSRVRNVLSSSCTNFNMLSLDSGACCSVRAVLDKFEIRRSELLRRFGPTLRRLDPAPTLRACDPAGASSFGVSAQWRGSAIQPPRCVLPPQSFSVRLPRPFSQQLTMLQRAPSPTCAGGRRSGARTPSPVYSAKMWLSERALARAEASLRLARCLLERF